MPNPLSQLGEDGLIKRFVARIGSAPENEVWSGDDAAVVEVAAGRMVITTDALVEGVDFELRYAAGYDVGWKTAAVNVSDVAAMGGVPENAVATLAIPATSDLAFIDDLLDGLVAGCKRWGARLVGGDLSRAGEVVLSVTLTGSLPQEPVLRSGAAPGDLICVTGVLGGSAGGLFALRTALRAPPIETLVERHLRPEARLECARGLMTAARPTSMIDVSDGFVVDAVRLMRASGYGCEIDPELIPIDPGLAALRKLAPDAPEPLDAALFGGEDLELLMTIPPAAWEQARMVADDSGVALTQVGEVTDGECSLGQRSLDEMGEAGWDHLRNR